MLSWCGNETLTKLLPLGPLPESPATEIGQRQRPNSQASIVWLIVGLFLSLHSFFPVIIRAPQAMSILTFGQPARRKQESKLFARAMHSLVSS